MWMLLLYALLVISVVVMIGVAFALFLRIRKKVNALPVEEPTSQSEVIENQ